MEQFKKVLDKTAASRIISELMKPVAEIGFIETWKNTPAIADSAVPNVLANRAIECLYLPVLAIGQVRWELRPLRSRDACILKRA
jgi:hypothetical protein